MKWEKIKLENIVSFRTGKLNSNAAIPNGIYPFYTCSKEIYKTNTASFNTEAVLLGGNNAVGDYPLFYVNGEFDAYQRTYIIEPLDSNTLNIRFLYYNLRPRLKDFQNYSTGASTKFLTLKILNAVEVQFPPLPTQRKIASILSAYDDLIENNLKRIKLLEEKALMEYRILYSNTKLNEYPIEDVWEIKYGKNLPQTKITESGKYPVYGAAGRIGFYEEFNYEFPVALVTSRGNGSGVAHRTNMSAFVTNNSFAFVPKEDFKNVHFHLSEMILRDLELTQLRSGTAQPQLTIAGLIGVKLKLPKNETLIVFNKIVDPVFDLIFTLEKQNTKLRSARDILLPRLMSGQIEV